MRALLTQVNELRAKILACPKKYPGLEADLQRLLPPDVLAATPHAQLQHLPRYLKAIQIRAERAAHNPAKDADKAAIISDYDHWQSHVAKVAARDLPLDARGVSRQRLRPGTRHRPAGEREAAGGDVDVACRGGTSEVDSPADRATILGRPDLPASGGGFAAPPPSRSPDTRLSIAPSGRTVEQDASMRPMRTNVAAFIIV